MPLTIPTLTYGKVTIRPLRMRDARVLHDEFCINHDWLYEWQATIPNAAPVIDTRGSVRSLQHTARSGTGLPFAVEYNNEFVGQLNINGIVYGSISSATIGYWVSERYAGRNIIPTAVALSTDYCFTNVGLHRVEICICPENKASLRVVEKLGFRYEGLRERYIHINGDWRDHLCFALVGEEVPEGVLKRWITKTMTHPK